MDKGLNASFCFRFQTKTHLCEQGLRSLQCKDFARKSCPKQASTWVSEDACNWDWKQLSTFSQLRYLASAFHLSELAIAGPVSVKIQWYFFSKGIFCVYIIYWCRWIVLIESEILITTRVVWLVSSDKQKAPLQLLPTKHQCLKAGFH